MNVVKERKEDLHINTARQCCTGIDDCTHTCIHVCAHKHYTDCWGEGQYYSVEVLREEECPQFVFEGRENSRVSDVSGEIAPRGCFHRGRSIYPGSVIPWRKMYSWVKIVFVKSPFFFDSRALLQCFMKACFPGSDVNHCRVTLDL